MRDLSIPDSYAQICRLGGNYETIIRPAGFDKDKNAITETGINFSEIHWQGRKRGHSEVYWVTILQVDFLPKIKIEVVYDVALEKVVNAVKEAACTSRTGDGKIFISPSEGTVRIRTANAVKTRFNLLYSQEGKSDAYSKK